MYIFRLRVFTISGDCTSQAIHIHLAQLCVYICTNIKQHSAGQEGKDTYNQATERGFKTEGLPSLSRALHLTYYVFAVLVFANFYFSLDSFMAVALYSLQMLLKYLIGINSTKTADVFLLRAPRLYQTTDNGKFCGADSRRVPEMGRVRVSAR